LAIHRWYEASTYSHEDPFEAVYTPIS